MKRWRSIIGLALLLCAFSRIAWANQVEEITTPYGFKAWVIEDHSLPLVSLHLAFKKSGFAYDPQKKQGLAFMVRSLLDEGAGDMDGIAFKKALEDHAIHLSFSVDEDYFYVRLKTLKENLPLALSLLKLSLTAPRFDDDAITRVRNQIYTLIASRKEDPDSIADEAFRATFFGKHPYSHVNTGDKASLAAITQEDLRAFVKAHFTRVPLVISMVGDIRKAEVQDALDRYLIDLPLSTADTMELAEFTDYPTSASLQKITVKQPQSIAIFGLKGVKRSDPDFYPAYVLNYILGGGSFTSRLMQEVREKKGLAYTVSTSLDVNPHAGLITGYVASKNHAIQESLAIVNTVFGQLQQRGVTQAEIDHAKSYLTGSFPLNLDKNEKLADFLLGMQLENLGQDFLEKRNGYINAVTLDDVNRVAARLLNPDTLSITVVGNNNAWHDATKQ